MLTWDEEQLRTFFRVTAEDRALPLMAGHGHSLLLSASAISQRKYTAREVDPVVPINVRCGLSQTRGVPAPTPGVQVSWWRACRTILAHLDLRVQMDGRQPGLPAPSSVFICVTGESTPGEPAQVRPRL